MEGGKLQGWEAVGMTCVVGKSQGVVHIGGVLSRGWEAAGMACIIRGRNLWGVSTCQQEG